MACTVAVYTAVYFSFKCPLSYRSHTIEYCVMLYVSGSVLWFRLGSVG